MRVYLRDHESKKKGSYVIFLSDFSVILWLYIFQQLGFKGKYNVNAFTLAPCNAVNVWLEVEEFTNIIQNITEQ